jgi:hypothetical protein
VAVVAPGLSLSPEILWGTLFLLGALAGVVLAPAADRWRTLGLLILCAVGGADCAAGALAKGAAHGDWLGGAGAALVCLGIWGGWTALFVFPAAGLGRALPLPASEVLSRGLMVVATTLATTSIVLLSWSAVVRALQDYRMERMAGEMSPCNMAPFLLFILHLVIYPPFLAFIALLWGLGAAARPGPRYVVPCRPPTSS